MKITRTSAFTGVTRTLDMPVTHDQITRWMSGELIQDAMPDLTHAQREFIKTGITAEEWDSTFGAVG